MLSSVAALFHDLPLVEQLTLATRSPAPWLVTGEDRIRLSVRNFAAGVTVRVSGRFLTADATVQPFAFDLVPATDGSASTADYGLGDGWILNCTARVIAGTPLAGQTWLLVDVVRGSGTVAVLLGTLLAQYVSTVNAAAWPGSLVQSATDGAGAPGSIAGANPAAGAEWTITVPANMRFRLRAVDAVLVTSATVANREVILRLTAGGVAIAAIPAGVTQVASETREYSWYPGAVRGAGSLVLPVIVPIPLVDLGPGDTITSITGGIQAGDDWGAPVAYGERFVSA